MWRRGSLTQKPSLSNLEAAAAPEWLEVGRAYFPGPDVLWCFFVSLPRKELNTWESRPWMEGRSWILAHVKHFFRDLPVTGNKIEDSAAGHYP